MTNNIEDKNQTNTRQQVQEPVADGRRQSRTAFAWASLGLMLASWILLMFNGYAAFFVAILAVIAGFFGTSQTSTTIKRLAVTAIIAATVLILIVGAYLIVLNFVLDA